MEDGEYPRRVSTVTVRSSTDEMLMMLEPGCITRPQAWAIQ
jgi:hypothetical protein